MRGRKPRAFSLMPADLPTLRQFAPSRTLPFATVQRSRVFLAVADGRRIQNEGVHPLRTTEGVYAEQERAADKEDGGGAAGGNLATADGERIGQGVVQEAEGDDRAGVRGRQGTPRAEAVLGLWTEASGNAGRHAVPSRQRQEFDPTPSSRHSGCLTESERGKVIHSL